MAAWTGWQAAVLSAGGWPNTIQNREFLSEWNGYEQSSCRNNPLNTTEPWAGATICNTVGVRNYATTSDGAQATAATLKNGFYPNIEAALEQGDPNTYANPQAVALEISRWGTPNFASVYLGGTVGGQVPTGSAGAAPTAAALAPKGHRGWADLRNTINRHIPTQVSRSQVLRLRALQTLAARSRVGR